MDTPLDRIRAKIIGLEARLSDLRIAERELLALEPAPTRKTKAAPASRARRKAAANAVAEPRQTIGAAIAGVLSKHGALPVAEIAAQIEATGREIDRRSVSFALQAMKKHGLVKSGDGKWMLRKARDRAAPA